MPKLSKSATKEERLAAHKRKMMGKFFRNKEWGDPNPETEKARNYRLAMNKEMGIK